MTRIARTGRDVPSDSRRVPMSALGGYSTIHLPGQINNASQPVEEGFHWELSISIALNVKYSSVSASCREPVWRTCKIQEILHSLLLGVKTIFDILLKGPIIFLSFSISSYRFIFCTLSNF